jgi:hypothetical protein
MGRKNYLSTATKARKFLNNLLNELREAGPEAPLSWYRAQTYITKALLEALALEKTAEIEARLERIEGLLAGYREEVRA